MGVIIVWNEKFILDCQNVVFCMFYESILEVIEKENIQLNSQLQHLIEDLERGCDGIGLDIARYIKTKDDLILLTNIVRTAIGHLCKKVPKMQYYQEVYEEFYTGLLEAQKNFNENVLK